MRRMSSDTVSVWTFAPTSPDAHKQPEDPRLRQENPILLPFTAKALSQ